MTDPTRRCPINHAICTYKCFMRHHCTTTPGPVEELLDRIDPLTTIAIGRILAEPRAEMEYLSPRLWRRTR